MAYVATNRRVSRDELIEFVRPRHHGVLLTTRKNGRPQSSLVTIGVGGNDDILISTYPERAKTHNIRRNPLVSVVVQSDEWNGEWVHIDGTATVVDLPEAVDHLVEYFRVISGEHPDWDEYRAAMQTQGKSLIRVTIDGWGPIAKGGFPARLVDNDDDADADADAGEQDGSAAQQN